VLAFGLPRVGIGNLIESRIPSWCNSARSSHRPELDAFELAEARLIKYRARDGLEVRSVDSPSAQRRIFDESDPHFLDLHSSNRNRSKSSGTTAPRRVNFGFLFTCGGSKGPSVHLALKVAHTWHRGAQSPGGMNARVRRG
jgi:hypothetical protein